MRAQKLRRVIFHTIEDLYATAVLYLFMNQHPLRIPRAIFQKSESSICAQVESRLTVKISPTYVVAPQYSQTLYDMASVLMS